VKFEDHFTGACPVKCLPNEMRSLFHRGEAYFIGAVPISLGRNLWIKNLLTNEKNL
jgi:hypothetical protein